MAAANSSPEGITTGPDGALWFAEFGGDETGDFNGDGLSDILWHDTSGNVAVWEMNGAAISQSAGIGNASASVWTVQGLNAD